MGGVVKVLRLQDCQLPAGFCFDDLLPTSNRNHRTGPLCDERCAYDEATNHMPVMDQPHHNIKIQVGDVIGVSASTTSTRERLGCSTVTDCARPTRKMTSATEPSAQIRWCAQAISTYVFRGKRNDISWCQKEGFDPGSELLCRATVVATRTRNDHEKGIRVSWMLVTYVLYLHESGRMQWNDLDCSSF